MSKKENSFNLVSSLLNNRLVSPATRRALRTRMEMSDNTPIFFTGYNFSLLKSICVELLNLDDDLLDVNVVLYIDARLGQDIGDGWRYENMPPDRTMYINGLKGVDQSAVLIYKEPFSNLPKNKKHAVLNALQDGTASGDIWRSMSSARFFEELLAEVTEVFYSHPFALEEISYIGMADVAGWKT